MFPHHWIQSFKYSILWCTIDEHYRNIFSYIIINKLDKFENDPPKYINSNRRY